MSDEIAAHYNAETVILYEVWEGVRLTLVTIDRAEARELVHDTPAARLIMAKYVRLQEVSR